MRLFENSHPQYACLYSPSPAALLAESRNPSFFLKSSFMKRESADAAKIFADGLCGLTVSDVQNASKPHLSRCAAVRARLYRKHKK